MIPFYIKSIYRWQAQRKMVPQITITHQRVRSSFLSNVLSSLRSCYSWLWLQDKEITMKRVTGSPDRSWALSGGLAWGQKADVTFTTRYTPESVSKREVLGFLGRVKPVEWVEWVGSGNRDNSMLLCFHNRLLHNTFATISLFDINVSIMLTVIKGISNEMEFKGYLSHESRQQWDLWLILSDWYGFIYGLDRYLQIGYRTA